MGLKTTNYTTKKFGLTVPNAYARLTNIHVDIDGDCDATFEVQQTRGDVGEKKALDRIHFNCKVDKEMPIHKQVYESAKTQAFVGWEDDIIE